MRRKAFFVLCVAFAIQSVCANQSNFFPKGVFEYSPPSKLRQSKVNASPNHQRDIDVWNSDFEVNTGWNLSGCWQIGAVELGPTSAHQGNSCLGTNLSGLYPNNSNVSASSMQIDIPVASYVELTFYEWFEFESGYDYGYVEIQSGNTIYRIDGRTGTSGNQWRQTALDLTQFAGSTIKINFHLTADASVPGAGWYIDEVCIIAQEPFPLTVNITGINTANYPSVYVNAFVNSPSGAITNLTSNNFSVSENNVTQQNNFTVITPSNNQQTSTSDIVFVLDVTGSMTQEINSVKQNMLSFVNGLTAQNVDYRIGLVVFGDIVYVYNNYNFYTNQQQILNMINAIILGEHGIGSGEDTPENQVEAMAEGSMFNWRPGAARILILLTDAPSHENDYVTQWTLQNLLASRLLPNDIIVFPIFDTTDQNQIFQYYPIAEATNPQGTYFDIYDNFNAIISQIGIFIASLYTIHYTTSTPLNSPITRIVKLQTTSGNETAEDYSSYLPGMSPAITRDTQTILYDTISQQTYSALNIDAIIVDIVPPNLISSILYWRRVGTTSYNELTMNVIQTSCLSATIPSTQVYGCGIEYYYSATDGQTTNTLPSANSGVFPFTIALLPNSPVSFNVVTQTYSSVDGLNISVNATSSQSLNLTLYYRPIGSLVYDNILMTHGTGTSYTAHVNENLSGFGVEYFIKAAATNGLITYKGFYDIPIQILISPQAEPINADQDWEICDLHCSPNPISISQSNSAFAKISFRVSGKSTVNAVIFNVKGERVRKLTKKNYNEGDFDIWWDLKDNSGVRVSSGVYFYAIESATQRRAGKLLIIK